MDSYFDIFVYVANWGAHECMLRLPKNLLDPNVARLYCGEEGSEVREDGDFVVIQYRSEEGGGYWVSDDEGPSWMKALLPVRKKLAMGDYRPFYSDWLSCLQQYDVDLDAEELPVPPGLRSLSVELRAMADFLRVDEYLLQVAGESSPDVDTLETVSEGIAGGTGRLAETEDMRCQTAMRRTVGQLLEAIDQRSLEHADVSESRVHAT